MNNRLNVAKPLKESCEVISDEISRPECEWTLTGFLWESKPFYPLIGESENCNVEEIGLDCKIKASLDFSEQLKKAQKAIAQGKKILWQIDLGLFENVDDLIKNTTHHESRLLALDYFVEKCWSTFKEHTFGLNLFKGPADFRKCFNCPSNDLQALFHLRGIAADYFSLLAARLPEELLLFLSFDADGLKESELSQVLNLELFDRFLFILKGASVPLHAITWEKGLLSYGGLEFSSQQEKSEVKTGFLLPSPDLVSSEDLSLLQKAIDKMKESNKPYRLLPESRITAYWDGLDELIAIGKTLSFSGKRQVQGFMAAGGTYLSI